MSSDRNDYLSQIITQQNNFYISLAAVYLLNDDDCLDKLKDSGVTLSGKIQFNFSAIHKCLSDDESRSKACSSFIMMAMKNLLTNSFETILDYANKNGCIEELKKTNWYEFARMCRNCLSHTHLFSFRPKDRLRLPIQWNEFIINIESEGNPLPNNFGPAQLRELVTEFRDFIKNT